MNISKKDEKNKSAWTRSDKRAKRLMRDYRIFETQHVGQATMFNDSGITPPMYNLTASAISWK